MTNPRLDRRIITTLAAGHFITDIAQGAIPAILPFLVVERGLSYAAASGVVLAGTVVSSIVQPLLGLYTDRKTLPWLMPLGTLVSGLAVGLSGAVTEYWLIVFCVLLGGLGVAAFHPEAYRHTSYASGSSKSAGISIFGLGGSLGFAIGPVALSGIVAVWGLPGSVVLAIPGSIMAFALVKAMPGLRLLGRAREQGSPEAVSAAADWASFWRVAAIILFRSAVYMSLMTYAPMFLVEVRGVPVTSATASNAYVAVGVTAGTVLTGLFGDRLNRKMSLTVISLAASLALVLMLAFGGVVTAISLVVAGAVAGATFNLAVVMSHEYVPGHIGAASGVTTGLAVGLGGAAVRLEGMLADSCGIRTVMMVLAVIPLLQAALACTLPRRAHRPHVA